MRDHEHSNHLDKLGRQPVLRAKSHTARRRCACLFPRYEDFVAMRRRFDPRGTFLNAHTRALFK
jgi:hypothetical protein